MSERLEALQQEKEGLLNQLDKLRLKLALEIDEVEKLQREMRNAVGIMACDMAWKIGHAKQQALVRVARTQGAPDPEQAVADAMQSVAKAAAISGFLPEDLFDKVRSTVISQTRDSRSARSGMEAVEAGNVTRLDLARARRNGGGRGA